MLERTENDKLKLDRLDLNIFFSSLFGKCNSENEVAWLQGQLDACVDSLAEERLEELTN